MGELMFREKYGRFFVCLFVFFLHILPFTFFLIPNKQDGTDQMAFVY